MVELVIQEMDLKGSILDYGAGIGQLTRRLLEHGRFSSVSAADIMATPFDLPEGIEWVEQDLNLPLAWREGAFDAVVASEVIEHLENPRFMIREFYRILRPGGVALITTPNNESWRSLLSLLIRGNYTMFGDLSYPSHITPLLRKDFGWAFTEAGFGFPKFYFTNDGGIPGKPVITWQQVSFGLLRGMRFSDNFMAVAVKRA
jgi:2-polyprenyl-3-methyl-5-hydroxy-6-metoxy-1,4-benzoquinol methylase